MEAAEIAVGMTARYSRTGTAGRVERIEVIEGKTFAELDTTGLLYRADTIEPVASLEQKRTGKKDDLKELVRKEQEFDRDLGDAWKQIDNACEGGG
ncbi:MAG: hypothetical protein PWP08_1363 [Methanofollis sp.]|nr:hypothetical protein [Methanofollis sp.]